MCGLDPTTSTITTYHESSDTDLSPTPKPGKLDQSLYKEGPYNRARGQTHDHPADQCCHPIINVNLQKKGVRLLIESSTKLCMINL